MGIPGRFKRPMVALAASTLAALAPPGVAPARAAAFPDVDVASVHDSRDLADFAESTIAGGGATVMLSGRRERGRRFTAPPAGIVLVSPRPLSRKPVGLVPARARLPVFVPESRRHAFAVPLVLSRFKAVSHGSSIEIRDVLAGLVVRAGQLLLPTGSQGARPAYFVLDFRPGWFWTAAQLRELGVEASFRPTRHLGLTLGGYNNRIGYRAGASVVRDAIGRVDVDLGVLKAGGFLYLGTGRWLGDSIRFGVDGRTRLGPVEFTGQVLRGAHRGIEQTGWYVDARHEIVPGLSLIARFDEHNPNVLAYSGLDLHGLLALVHQRSPAQTFKLNFQASFADPKRTADSGRPIGWAVIVQIWQRL